ncbi:MAG: hypothetical protein IBX56_11795, partial [Methylomicrobium sp.]|nr:hypothetical protein [Methylomicrobium sp.]
MREKLFLGLLITIVLLALNLTVGINDYLMLVLAVVIAYITQSVVIELQMGGRALIADHFNSASKLKIILKTPGILTKILSFIVALLFSISFLAFAKGVMIKHGFVAVIIISFAMTVVLYHLFAPVEKNAF